ncbi:hypothetical protein AVEN_128337-1 [Araneus ventricosus]|uniref:Uncharacterized protein n=1 Tax=Araneus ventricosus TaxID=182803 RepID=A0A4Y2DC24_ARAVE|nr:hypothetical protein AVEN_128337-1 [Araneus ventricosus]
MRFGSVFDHPLFGRSNYDGNKSQTTERRNMGLGYRDILIVFFRKAYYRERVLFFSPTLPGGPNCILFKGPTCHRASWQPRQSATGKLKTPEIKICHKNREAEYEMRRTTTTSKSARPMRVRFGLHHRSCYFSASFALII